MTPTISVSDAFDGGNIKLMKKSSSNKNETDLILQIKPDIHTELEQITHLQYFAFRVTIGSLDGPHTVNYVLENAEHTSYPEAWSGKFCMMWSCFWGLHSDWSRF